MKKLSKEAVEPEYPKVVISYSPPQLNYVSMEPNVFNNRVSWRKYKTTIEVVDEPLETLQERLELLWSESDNHHHYWPLMEAAKEIDYKFKGSFGSKIK